MKTPTALSLGALALSAVALVFALGRSVSVSTEPKTLRPQPGAEVARLLERVEELSDQNRALSLRIAELELRPAPPTRTPALDSSVGREEFERTIAELRGLAGEGELDALRGLTSEELPPRAELTRLVEASLEEIRRQDEVERRERRRANRVAKVERELPLYRDWLGLDAVQEEQLRTALLTQVERESALSELWEQTGDVELSGQQKQQDQADFLIELGAFLTPDQLETFTSKGGADEGGAGGK